MSEYSDRIDGLAAYLAFRIRYTSPKIISVLEVLTEGIQVQLKEPLVWYGPKDIEGRSPKEWKALPKKYKELSTLIKEIDMHIHPNEDSQTIRRQNVEGLNKTWNELYTDLILQGKLRWAEDMGREDDSTYNKFPYAVTTSKNLGCIGKDVGGLYFVAKDIAKKPWQEKVVAYHQKYCSQDSRTHEYASGRELGLVRQLGKEKEYKRWRDNIDMHK